jgi:hypothetical protein
MHSSSPKFNVSEPFLGITMVQMNKPMTLLLQRFIDDIDGIVETEIMAFRNALEDPATARVIRQKKLKNGRRDRRHNHSQGAV